MNDLIWLHPDKPVFPDTRLALEQPSGLLAAGGNLDVSTLSNAYYLGIFPWYSEQEPPLWWSPNLRAVLCPNDLHVSRSTQKAIKQQKFKYTSDMAFEEIITQCSDQRSSETWILDEMIDAYIEMHEAGKAHSIEVWDSSSNSDNVADGDSLVGGLYGIQIGSVFCGESMFHKQANASKLAFICLAKTLFSNGFSMIDCQLTNPFLESLGVAEISRNRFEEKLTAGRDLDISWPKNWQF